MKLNQIINLHKGLTAFVVIGLMIFFDNFTIAPYIYLALHGTYGLLWLLKEKIVNSIAAGIPKVTRYVGAGFFGILIITN